MDRYEPFDLKITKLTGTKWRRENVAALLRQLIEEQGKPRYSVENRIIIAFDRSIDSSVQFLRANKEILLEALLNIAYNPYVFTYRLDRNWLSAVLIRNYRHGQKYQHHSIGAGMREPEKAEFENELLQVAAQKSDGLIRYNPDTKEHGHDGDLRINEAKIKAIDAQIVSAPVFEVLKLHICDYRVLPVPDWPNCLLCPLYKDGHCLSRGATIYQKIHLDEEGIARS